MPTPIPAGYGEFTLVWDHTGDPDPYTVAFGFGDDGTHSISSQTGSILAHWVTDFSAAANMIAGYSLREARGVLNRGGVLSEIVIPSGVVGTYAVTPLPQNNALLVKKNSGLVGRANRGRMYLPPCYVDKGGIDTNGTILAATVTTLNGRLATFLGHLITDLNSMVILHSSGATPTGVSSIVLENVVASQRRRLRS